MRKLRKKKVVNLQIKHAAPVQNLSFVQFLFVGPVSKHSKHLIAFEITGKNNKINI